MVLSLVAVTRRSDGAPVDGTVGSVGVVVVVVAVAVRLVVDVGVGGGVT